MLVEPNDKLGIYKHAKISHGTVYHHALTFAFTDHIMVAEFLDSGILPLDFERVRGL